MKRTIQLLKSPTAVLYTAISIGFMSVTKAQHVSISPTGNPPDNSAALDIRDYTDKGILIPRLTTAQRNAIPSPANSLLIFNTDCNVFQVYNASTNRWYDLLQSDYGAPTITFANSVTFNYSGSVQSWIVPNGVCWIKIKAWGSGGGGGSGTDAGAGRGGHGGGGGYVEKILKVSSGDVIQIYVGGGGIGGPCGAGAIGGNGGWGYGNGGKGGNSGTIGWSGAGGGGGGATSIIHNGNLILVAAGGGGGGGNGPCGGSAIGDGGAAGNNGTNGSATGGIAGSSSNINGAPGGDRGSADGGSGGGGGGGYNGGTGGTAPSCDCGGGGGGGGSSYCIGSNCIISNGSGQNPGNAADPDRPAGIGIGGNGGNPSSCQCNTGTYGSNGGNGFVKIYY